MRIIDAWDKPIRTVAVSPDGRFVAASALGGWVGVCDWHTGAAVRSHRAARECEQFAFAPDGGWVAYVGGSGLWFDRLDESAPVPPELQGAFAGGVAVSANGKKLVAVRAGSGGRMGLAVWDLPTMRPQPGFDDWPPFRRMALSRNGDFLAGVWPGTPHAWRPVPAGFQLRFARTGGADYKYPPMTGPVFDTPGFVSFTHDSTTCAFGWDGEFRVIDLSTGTGRELKYVKAPFRDAAFTGSGRHFATVGDAGALALWDVRAWQVVREYDWQCGPLTCLAFTADGSAGVCGTADGKLVQFDVDE